VAPRIRTSFTELLGIDYPIIGAPMFLVSYEDLTVAVSEAGGLGAFPLPNYRTVADLAAALRDIRSRTSRPIGVNIHVSGRFPWQEQLDLCLDAGVKFFITSLGDPQLILAQVHARGGLVYADVVSLGQGIKARDRGVDGLVAVGAGAGGHTGFIPTQVFVPYLKAKTGLPVVAAGGISTGAQMAAALTVGACAVIVGTRLIATPEAQAVTAYKQAVVDAGPEDIVLSSKLTGNPANWLRESVAKVDRMMPAGAVVAEMVDEYRRVCQSLTDTLT